MRCSNCGTDKLRSAFSKTQLQKKGARKCRECIISQLNRKQHRTHRNQNLIWKKCWKIPKDVVQSTITRISHSELFMLSRDGETCYLYHSLSDQYQKVLHIPRGASTLNTVSFCANDGIIYIFSMDPRNKCNLYRIHRGNGTNWTFDKRLIDDLKSLLPKERNDALHSTFIGNEFQILISKGARHGQKDVHHIRYDIVTRHCYKQTKWRMDQIDFRHSNFIAAPFAGGFVFNLMDNARGSYTLSAVEDSVSPQLYLWSDRWSLSRRCGFSALTPDDNRFIVLSEGQFHEMRSNGRLKALGIATQMPNVPRMRQGKMFITQNCVEDTQRVVRAYYKRHYRKESVLSEDLVNIIADLAFRRERCIHLLYDDGEHYKGHNILSD